MRNKRIKLVELSDDYALEVEYDFCGETLDHLVVNLVIRGIQKRSVKMR